LLLFCKKEALASLPYRQQSKPYAGMTAKASGRCIDKI
jgi:hypothetical protein